MSADFPSSREFKAFLKIAIQSALFEHRNELDQLWNEQRPELLEELTDEILGKAVNLEKITNEVMNQFSAVQE
ncbi:hypothetical protein [Marinicrinis lubricantis]|uniref:Uncharacterized protein n=1 Tax=Marinicrinis lubricantis TaxID=2086470 RepID=A0ABW1IJ49_9BACL